MTSIRIPVIFYVCLKYFYLILIICLGLANAPPALAKQSLAAQSILPNAQILLDENKLLDARDIFANPEHFSFEAAPQSLSLGYYRGAVWLNVQQTFDQPHKAWLVFEPTFIDDIRLFQKGADGLLNEWRTGDHIPFLERPLTTRKMALPIDLPAGHSQFLLRVETSSTFTLSAKLWSAEDFLLSQQAETLFYGVLFGLIVLAVLASILCALWTNQRFFWIVSGYLLCFGLLHFTLNGFDQQYIYPTQGGWSDSIVGLTACSAAVFLALFVAHYLRLDVHLPQWQKFMRVCTYVSLAAAIISLAGFYASIVKIFMWFALILLGSIILVSLQTLKYERQRALLLLITFSPGIIAVVLQAIRNLGGLPLNFWTTHVWAISAMFQVSFTLLVVILKLREDELEIQQQREQSEALRRFYNLMAHELRAPVAVIETALTNMQRQLEPELPSLQPRFRRIKTAIARLNNLMDNALAEDRLSQLDMPLNIENIHLSDLIEEIKSLVLITDKHRLDVELPNENLCFQADRQWLVLALLNLLDNAVKYAPNGGQIFFSVTHDETHIKFSVLDEGIGVASEDRPHLFKRFYRGSPAINPSQPTGLGLGLYLVALVAERHRGKAGYLALEQGSCFYLQLPL